MPTEFGDGGKESVYYSEGKKIHSISNRRQNENFLGEFSKINLFVGANNSGKSRFLRGLLKSESQMFEISSSIKNIEYWSKEYQNWISKELAPLNRLNIAVGNDVSSIMHDVNRLQDDYNKIVGNSKSYLTPLNNIISKEILDVSEIKKSQEGNKNLSLQEEDRIEALVKKLELFHILKAFKNEIEYAVNNQVHNKIYIPILRSINRSTKIDKRSFIETIEELYDLDSQRYTLFTGLDLFDQVLYVRNDLKEKRKGFEEFETFLSSYFFEGKNVEIISHIKEKVIRIYVDREERKIHDVGDGIQSLILLLFPIYTAQNNSWVFIEEPETHLHPGLQRIFIETLLKDDFLESKNLRYFFTTHSNHFLDLTIEMDRISIFQFEKKEKNRYEIKTNVKPDNSILDILGVNSSSVFLANSSIWVEGPTDRKYISKWLKLYIQSQDGKKHLKEDIDFTFFEYGGNLIAHYLFDKSEEEGLNYDVVSEKINAFSLSNKIVLLADEDGAKRNSKKGKRRIKLTELSNIKENFKYLNTIVIEIENLLPVRVIEGFSKNLVQDEYHERLNNVKFKNPDYSRTRLGKYYKDRFKKLGIPENGLKSFMADSGTLKNDYKLKLCNYFLECELKYDELVKDNRNLQKIIEELYQFIKV